MRIRTSEDANGFGIYVVVVSTGGPKNNNWERESQRLDAGGDGREVSEETLIDSFASVSEPAEIMELLQIICEEGEKIFGYPGFAEFVDLVWRQGYSRNEAWNKLKTKCTGYSKATFFRRFGELRQIVERRRTS